jgi:anti-sigma B factor antagonist
MPPFLIEHSTNHGIAYLRVRGDVDTSTALRVRNALRAATDDKQHNVVVDLCEVELLDANGIGVLMRYAKSLREQERRLFVVCPPGNVRRVLELCMLSRRLGVHATRDEAVAAAAAA